MAWWVYDIREGSLPLFLFFFVSQRGFGYIFPLFFPLDVVNFVGLEEEALDSLEESTARRLCLLLWKRRGHIRRRKAFRFGWLGNRSMRDREEQSAPAEGRPRVFLSPSRFILWIDIAVTYIYVHSLKIDAHFFVCFLLLYVPFFAAVAMSTTEGSRASQPYFFVVLQYDGKKIEPFKNSPFSRAGRTTPADLLL